MIDPMWKEDMDYSAMQFFDSKVVVRDQTFPLHEAVITTRCSTLMTKLSEQEPCEKFLDHHPADFQSFLQFLYNGRWKETIGLKTLADEYRVPELVRLCDHQSNETASLRYI